MRTPTTHGTTHSSGSPTLNPSDASPGATNLIKEEVKRQAAQQVQQIHESLHDILTSMQPGQKRAAAKARPGAEVLAGEVYEIAVRYDVRLPTASPERLQADLNKVRDLAPLQLAVNQLAQAVNDTVFGLRSGIWTGALDLYKTLQRVGKQNAEVMGAIRPIQERLALGKAGSAKQKEAQAASQAGQQAAASPAVTEASDKPAVKSA